MQRVWHVNRCENGNKKLVRETLECPSRHFFFQATYFQNCLCVILHERDCKNSSSFDLLNWSRSMARNSVLYLVTWRRKQKQCPKRCVLKDLGGCRMTTWSEFYDGVVDIWGQSLCLQHIRGMARTLPANIARGRCFGSGTTTFPLHDRHMISRQTRRPVDTRPSADRMFQPRLLRTRRARVVNMYDV
jgi:hypothetical protein